MDFFVQQLAGENCLAVPPVDLIIRTLHYLYACRATATLVVPFWPSAQFWPLIAREYRDCIVESRLFNGRTALVHGMNKNSLLGSQRFFGDVTAIRLNFNLMRELHTDANQQTRILTRLHKTRNLYERRLPKGYIFMLQGNVGNGQQI